MEVFGKRFVYITTLVDIHARVADTIITALNKEGFSVIEKPKYINGGIIAESVTIDVYEERKS